MAVIQNGIIWAIGPFDLIERLRDQEALQAIACHEGQRGFEKVEPAQRWELVEHQEEPVSSTFCIQVFGQAAANLIENEAHQRLGPADVRRRDYKIERCRPLVLDKVADAPIALACDLRHDGITIKAEERHGG